VELSAGVDRGKCLAEISGGQIIPQRKCFGVQMSAGEKMLGRNICRKCPDPHAGLQAAMSSTRVNRQTNRELLTQLYYCLTQLS